MNGRPGAATIAGVAALVALGALLLTDFRDDDEPAEPPTPEVMAANPTLTVVERLLPTAPPVACSPECLVRLPDSDQTRDALARQGLRPAYAHDDQLWTMAPVSAIQALRGTIEPITLVADSVETLPLYVMRVPNGGSDHPVREAGEVLDQIDNQFIVRVPKTPPPVRALAEAGIWIEKLPPAPAGPPTTRGELPPLPELGTLLAEVAAEELERTIVDLQGMGATDGSGVGSRYYGSAGNAMAAEYLYQRLDAYGIDVWYEEFITESGVLAVNVVGEIPGEDPSKVYLVLGHFDSIAGNAAIAPGADDNATGVAGMLEIARILAKYQLAHPVRFFFSNVEEVGLQGVTAFVARAGSEGVPIAGAFNLDGIGSGQHGSQLVLNADEASSWLQNLLIRLNSAHGLGQGLLVRQSSDVVGDDNILRETGYPTVLVARELFGWTTLHHTPDDVVDTVDLYNVQTATQLVLLGVAALVG